jgi:hypothetical protein
MVALKAFLFVFYAIPLGVGIWWLVLFNRKGIRSQFAGTPVLDQPEAPTQPNCPFPVAVIAWFMLFSFATTLPLALFLHFPFPVILFGRLIHGNLGYFLFFASMILFALAAIGVLKLKRWSYPFLLGIQLFWLANGTITFLGPITRVKCKKCWTKCRLLRATYRLSLSCTAAPGLLLGCYLHWLLCLSCCTTATDS